MESEALLARIRKLLAMAESEDLEEAARASYNAKAADLIARYGIDQALVEEKTEERASAADVRVDVDAPYALAKLDLLATVATSLGCKVIKLSKPRLGGTTDYTAHLFGMTPDLERSQILYTSLLVQQAYGLAAAQAPPGENTRSYRLSWMIGFAAAVGSRLRAAEARARDEAAQRETETATSVALVLASRESRVTALVNAAYPKLRNARPTQSRGSGSGAGWNAGQRADLGTKRVGASRRQLS